MVKGSVPIEQGTRSFMVQVIQGSTTEKICSGVVSTNACFFDILWISNYKIVSSTVFNTSFEID